MTNLKRGEVSYQPFEGHAILADGLLAVQRPAGEVAASLSQSLFGAADVFAADAERIGRNRIEDAATAVRVGKISSTISGGDRGQGGVAPNDETIIQKDLMPPKGGSNVVNQAIARAAAKYGQSPSTMRKIAMIESRLNPNAKNPTSSAAGLFQQIDDNAAQYGVNDRLDPYQSSDGAARFMRDNTNYLTKRLGRPPTEGEVYLAHQQGGGGAYELLKDPSALAVNVIGRARLLKNGGNVNMTAGQFAAMWTSKLDGNNPQPASNGFGAMPTIDLGDNSFDVKPAERSALEISFKGDAPALTGRDTIWGRAYDKAVTDAYSSKLQNEMLTASDEIAQKYADDPTGMREAFSQLKEAQLQHDVPDSIHADYENAHDRMSRSALKSAQTKYEKNLHETALADWTAASTGFKEGVGRAQIGLEAGSQDGMAAMAGQAQRLKQHWREGVAQGFISPKQAQEVAQRLDGDVQAQWYVAQAKGSNPADIETLRSQLQTDYVDGKLTGIDARAWNKIDTSLKRMGVDAQQEISGKTAKLGKLTDSVLNRVALGYQIAPAEIEALRGAANNVENGDQIVSGALSILDMGSLLRLEPVGFAEGELQKMKTEFGATPTDEQVNLIGRAEKMVHTARVALSTDLLGYAERSGVIDNAGSISDVKVAGDMQELIAKRVEAGQLAAQHFGVDEQYFKPGEVKAIEDMVVADPEQGAAMAGAIIQGAGPRTAQVLKEFGKTAPVLAGAGAIIADGGDVTAARDAIAGAGKDQSGNAYSEKGWRERRAVASEVAGTAMRFQEADQQRIMDTAERIARKRISDAGVEADSPEATDITKRAVNEAAGAVYAGDVQYGGFANFDPWYTKSGGTVAVPNFIRADKLADVIDAVRPDDLVVQPRGGLDAMQSQMPVLTSLGYVFVQPDAQGNPVPLAGDDGKPFILNLEKLAPRLAARVPGTYRGY
jgi:hypothetical protein